MADNNADAHGEAAAPHGAEVTIDAIKVEDGHVEAVHIEGTLEAGHDAAHHGAGHGADVAHAAADAAHGSGGMPQLDPSSFPHQVFWLIVALVAIYFLLTRIAIPRIGGTIENRRRAIARDLDRAAELKKQAEAADQAYAEALRNARTEAQKIADQNNAKIQKDLDAAVAKADAEIAEETRKSQARIDEMRGEADKSVVEVAKATAKALAEALVPGGIDGGKLDGAVNRKVKG